MSTPPPEDETRLAPSTSAVHASSSAPTANSSGWLASSGAIDHGRFPPGTILGAPANDPARRANLVGGLAAYAFHVSRAGGGLLRRFVPSA
ncbi:MAG: hypothetical protein M3468_08205 [Acidobacteriota bacterium]|nr:hypothetical protein [Acidobacteriota bacterium]